MVRFSHDTQIVLWLDFYVIHHGIKCLGKNLIICASSEVLKLNCFNE